jgi:hypothetical protein
MLDREWLPASRLGTSRRGPDGKHAEDDLIMLAQMPEPSGAHPDCLARERFYVRILHLPRVVQRESESEGNIVMHALPHREFELRKNTFRGPGREARIDALTVHFQAKKA